MYNQALVSRCPPLSFVRLQDPSALAMPPSPYRLDALVNRRDTQAQILPSTFLLCPIDSLSCSRDQEPSLANHVAKLRLTGEPLDALHKILVRVTIARHDLANQRDRAETPPLIHGVGKRVGELRCELETRKHTAGLQDAERFLQRLLLVGEVPDPKRYGVQVDAVVRDLVQLLGVGLHEAHAPVRHVLAGAEALLTFAEHGGVDVGNDDGSAVVVVDVGGVVEHALGNVAGAAGDVEDPLRFGGRLGRMADARVQRGDEMVFPKAMDAE
nr:hypothetical protein CFP56_32322 [Quercus suber]